MKKISRSMLLALACAFVMLGVASLKAADEPAKVAGTWEITSEGRNGPQTQTLTIEQDGGTIKGTLSGRMGDTPFTGTVDGNKISFQIKRETQNGTFTADYSATVDGDAMKGKIHTERGDRDFTGKRK